MYFFLNKNLETKSLRTPYVIRTLSVTFHTYTLHLPSLDLQVVIF